MRSNNDAVYPLIATLLLGGLVTLTVVLLFVGKPMEISAPTDQLTAESSTGQTDQNAVVQESTSTEISAGEQTDASATAQDEDTDSGTVHTIKMLNTGEDGSMVFEPGYLLAQPGDTVIFEPADMAHNTKSVLVPDGADSWQSNINEGITLTLNEEGVYIYVCEPHSALAMAGVIQVGEAVNLDAAKAKVDELNPSFVLGKDRLAKYLDAADAGSEPEESAEPDADVSANKEVVPSDTAEEGGETDATDSSDATDRAAATDTKTTEAGVADNSSTQPADTTAETKKDVGSPAVHTIKMLNTGEDGLMVFEPGFVLAQPGDTIVFEPTDMAHNTKSALVPDGAEPWESSINEGITLTLTEEGVYLYLCVPHSPLAMAGVIQVGEAVNLEVAQAKATELEATFAIAKDRLAGYMSQVQ